MTKCRICKKEFKCTHKQQTICHDCVDRGERIMKRDWDIGNKKERAHWRRSRTTCIICNKPLNSLQKTTCVAHQMEWMALRREVYKKWKIPMEPKRNKHRNPQCGRHHHDYHNDNLAVDIMNAKLSGMSYGEYMSKRGKNEK